MKKKLWSPWEGTVVKNLCTECGSEMTSLVEPGWMTPCDGKPDYHQCPECGHEEKVS